MARVRMLTCEAGPGGAFLPGSVRTVTEAHAAELVAGKFAERLEEETATSPAETAVAGDVETAVQPSAETAVAAPVDTADDGS